MHGFLKVRLVDWSIRRVDVRLPRKGRLNSHGARPVHLIITMMKWIPASRFLIKNALFGQVCCWPLPKPRAAGKGAGGRSRCCPRVCWYRLGRVSCRVEERCVCVCVKERDRERARERQREKEGNKDRQRETERDRKREREREKERKRT